MTCSPLSGCQPLSPLAFAPRGCLLAALPWGTAEGMPSWLEKQLFYLLRWGRMPALGLACLCRTVGGALTGPFAVPETSPGPGAPLSSVPSSVIRKGRSEHHPPRCPQDSQVISTESQGMVGVGAREGSRCTSGSCDRGSLQSSCSAKARCSSDQEPVLSSLSPRTLQRP